MIRKVAGPTSLGKSSEFRKDFESHYVHHLTRKVLKMADADSVHNYTGLQPSEIQSRKRHAEPLESTAKRLRQVKEKCPLKLTPNPEHNLESSTETESRQDNTVSQNNEVVQSTPFLEEFKRAEAESVTLGPGMLLLKKNSIGVRGLYADRDFVKGQYVTMVAGKHEAVNSKRLEEIKSDPKLNQHLLMVSYTEVIHGLQEPEENKGAGSFANDGSCSELFASNCQFTLIETPEKSEVYLQGLRDIKTGEEIRVFYGKEHWTMVKKTDPDLYDLIFKQQILTVNNALKVTEEHDRHQSLNDVLKFFQYTPVPYLPEWKNKEQPQVWSPYLIRYYMFKLTNQARFLTPFTLKDIDPASDEYLKAVTAYIKSFPEWNNYSKEIFPVPDARFFKERGKWSKAHVYYLKWREDKDDAIFTSQLVNSLLTIIPPDHSDFNHFLKLHLIQRFTKHFSKSSGALENEIGADAIPTEQPTRILDFTVDPTYQTAKHIIFHLKNSNTPLPDFLQKSIHQCWTYQSLILTLEKFDILVIQAPKKVTPVDYQLLRDAIKSGSTKQYLDKFSEMCKQKDYKFKKFVSYFGSQGGTFPIPTSSIVKTHWDNNRFTASCLALFLEGNPDGVTNDALKYTTIPLMVDALQIMNITKHTTTTVQILRELAKQYARPGSMTARMIDKGIPPETGRVWDNSYVKYLKHCEN